MRNVDQWKETKWTLDEGRLMPKNVAPSSRHIAELQALAYQLAFEKYAAYGWLADLGCGEVPMYLLYKAFDRNPFCVDWGESLHDVKHADEIADLNTEWQLGRMGGFHTACAWDVLEHLYDPLNLFESAKWLLQSGGHFICAAPFMYWIHEAPHDYHRYTEYGLRKYCDLAGLEVVECEPYGDAVDVLIDISAKTGFGQLTPPVTRKNRFPLGYVLVARKP